MQRNLDRDGRKIYEEFTEAVAHFGMLLVTVWLFNDGKTIEDHPRAMEFLIVSALIISQIRAIHLAGFPITRHLAAAKAIAIMYAAGSYTLITDDPVTAITPAMIWSAREARDCNWISEQKAEQIETVALAGLGINTLRHGTSKLF